MAGSARIDGSPGAEGRPDYGLEHLPADFEAGGGHAWADFLRREPLRRVTEDDAPRMQNCWLVETIPALHDASLGPVFRDYRRARAIFVEGSFGIVGHGMVFRDAWLVVWEESALFVIGDKQFKELYEPVPETPQMGGEDPAATNDPLVAFFYVLLRQMASPGDVEQQVHAMESAPPPPAGAEREWNLTNAYLHGYAENLVSRLRGLETATISPGSMPVPDAVERGVANLVREMLLLRRFQLFPVQYVTLREAQRWMGSTESEAEAALDAMTQRGSLEVTLGGVKGQKRWSLNRELRAQAVENPPLELPVDAVEEREKRYEMEERIGAVVAACRRFEKDREGAAKVGLPGDIARAQGEIQAAAYFRELIGEKLPPPTNGDR